MLKVKIYFTSI